MYPPSAARLRPRRARSPGRVRDRRVRGRRRARRCAPARRETPCPSSSAVRLAPTTTARTWKKPHSGQCQSPAMRPHQRQCGAAWDDGSDNGPGRPRNWAGVPAAPAREPGDVAAPRDLHQDGPVLQRTPRRLEREVRQARGAGGGVPGELRVLPGVPDAGHRRPDALPVRRERVRPPRFDELGRVGGAREPPDQRRRARPVGAQGEHLARVRVRRVRLGVDVVPVVPQHDQPEVGDGREHRGAGPHHRPRGPRRTASHLRYRSAGPSSAVSAT